MAPAGRAIGVSNFTVAGLTAPATGACLSPQANQIRFCIGHTQPKVTAFAARSSATTQSPSRSKMAA